MTNIIALVEKKKAARVDSLLIAEHLQIQHKNILALIDDNKPIFEEFGRLAFETRKGEPLPQGGFAKSTRYALLNEDQAYYLLTLTRNNERTKRLKAELIKAFSRFRRHRQTAEDYLPFYHELQEDIKALAVVARQNGSTTDGKRLYTNFNRLINSAFC
jgi:phage regulator Rha-like protein